MQPPDGCTRHRESIANLDGLLSQIQSKGPAKNAPPEIAGKAEKAPTAGPGQRISKDSRGLRGIGIDSQDLTCPMMMKECPVR
jgi:hypothetical protein